MLARHVRAIAHGLVLVSAMLALIAAALWFRTGPLESQALARVKALSTDSAGIPDSGKQRKEMVDQLKVLNSRLKEIEDGFRNGTYVIQTTEQKARAEPGKGGTP